MRTVQILVRRLGEGWRMLSLPVTPPAAHTLTRVAETLELGDQVRVACRSGEDAVIDVKV